MRMNCPRLHSGVAKRKPKYPKKGISLVNRLNIYVFFPLKTGGTEKKKGVIGYQLEITWVGIVSDQKEGE